MNKIVLVVFLLFFSTAIFAKAKVQLGAEQSERYLPLLKGKSVGLVLNQTSRIGSVHLVDFLKQNNIDVKILFAPEHGVRGNKGAGELIKGGIDEKSGAKIVSIYGKNKKPPQAIMQSLDVVVFDIQDVGTRFYTYISSMHYMMEASAKSNTHFIVLDRPNPNGMYIDGPVLEEQFRSFVGMHPIPILHGLTVGELALMIKGEKWIENAKNLKLSIVGLKNYQKSQGYSLPIPPSPNLPNDKAIQLYPSLCLFEASAVSVGRGTDYPFQLIAHDEVKLGNLRLTPKSISHAAPNPKLQGRELYALDLRNSEIKGFDLALFIETYRKFGQRDFITHPDFFDKLAGTDKLRKAILKGESLQKIRDSWQVDLKAYKERRKRYLLYSE